ncbi:hypothetical protein EXN66_Car013115 [Channa argus]|uniref:Uncharacterized protein n=1 Tax=Channa argus TaxID=215402 RepID=A0A6G1Q4H1_CHAAH|nr:hypothetical protein EXN66_Car022546 [Channa argus]KAF3697435.1 hypothetical protein EXN66_Car013115 [Channa argus]
MMEKLYLDIHDSTTIWGFQGQYIMWPEGIRKVNDQSCAVALELNTVTDSAIRSKKLAAVEVEKLKMKVSAAFASASNLAIQEGNTEMHRRLSCQDDKYTDCDCYLEGFGVRSYQWLKEKNHRL